MAFIETTDTDTTVIADSARSRQVLNAFVEESFMNHQQGMSTVHIERSMDELRAQGIPSDQKVPWDIHKTIVFKLSHSLTTELSEQLTRSLTVHLVDYFQLVP